MFCNEKGQAFDVFKLLIAAVLGLAILVIILSIINYLEVWKEDISKRLLKEGLDNAVQTPNGEVVVRKNLTLKKGNIFSTAGLARQSGLKEECVEITSSKTGAYLMKNTGFLEIKSDILADVFFQCFKNYFTMLSCDPYCIVSFGKELKKT